jgi:hypothetical protein
MTFCWQIHEASFFKASEASKSLKRRPESTRRFELAIICETCCESSTGWHNPHTSTTTLPRIAAQMTVSTGMTVIQSDNCESESYRSSLILFPSSFLARHPPPPHDIAAKGANADFAKTVLSDFGQVLCLSVATRVSVHRARLAKLCELSEAHLSSDSDS